MNDETSFGPLLTQQRLARGLAQEALADAIGYSPETIRKIELGRRWPSGQMVQLLADYFGVPPDEREDLIRMAHQRSWWGGPGLPS